MATKTYADLNDNDKKLVDDYMARQDGYHDLVGPRRTEVRDHIVASPDLLTTLRKQQKMEHKEKTEPRLDLKFAEDEKKRKPFRKRSEKMYTPGGRRG